MTTNADVNQVAETIVLAFVSQQAEVQPYVPLGFACDINATNIQITISKLKFNTKIRNLKISYAY